MTSILVVEDEPGISSFVAKGLTSAGYNVTVVDKGAEAISGALGGDYSLIVLDIGLPDMDGFEVLEQIRGQGATLPIIVLTARSSVEDTVSGLNRVPMTIWLNLSVLKNFWLGFVYGYVPLSRTTPLIWCKSMWGVCTWICGPAAPALTGNQ